MTMTLHPLRLSIESAFTGVPLPSGFLTRHRTPECAELDRHLLGKTWRNFAANPLEFFKLVGQIPLLTPDAYYQFLPIYLLAALEHPEQADALVQEWVFCCDAPRHQMLNLRQLQVVREVLTVLGGRDGYAPDPDFKNAIAAIDGLISEKQKGQ